MTFCFYFCTFLSDPLTSSAIDIFTLRLVFVPAKLDAPKYRMLLSVDVTIVFQLSQSDENKVTLRHLSLASTGRYRCEVSSEAPMFVTDSGYGDLLVVVVPQDGPVIQGAEDRYDTIP